VRDVGPLGSGPCRSYEIHPRIISDRHGVSHANG
jgi:hypothetical protein